MRPLLALTLLLLAAPSAPAQEKRPDPNRALRELLQRTFQDSMRRWPTWASVRGDRRFDDRLNDVSPAAWNKGLQQTRARLATLKTIDRAGLDAANKVSADLLQYELALSLEGARFKEWQQPVSQINGPQQSLPQLPARLSFTTTKHRTDFLKRLEAIPAFLKQVIANMRQGLEAKRTPPRVVMGRAAEQAFAQARGAPAKHPLFAPFAKLPANDPLRARALQAIQARVMPAFQRLGAFLRDEYVPGCRATIAASARPDGPAYYAWKLRSFTTTRLSASAIHATGLKEVARIRKEMLATIRRSDFPHAKKHTTDAALFAAFLAYLRASPRFYHKRKRDLLDGYRAIAKRVDAELPRLFGKLPRLPYGVKEMPAFIAPTAPTAYYYSGSLKNGTPGWFVANTYKLDQRPRYEMIPLTLHEAVPGHHLQIALARELSGLPEWRKTRGYTVFVEGWALYAERLGLEMGSGKRGLYEDPYDDFGRLTYEMWRAMRLVVDTGIHAKGWSRDKAIGFMLANSALTRTNVEREVDRYITWPGQAVAYKIGELKIRALRARAEQQLGKKFDVRAFHDTVLGQGAVPLHVLEAQVEAWIRKTR